MWTHPGDIDKTLYSTSRIHILFKCTQNFTKTLYDVIKHISIKGLNYTEYII